MFQAKFLSQKNRQANLALGDFSSVEIQARVTSGSDGRENYAIHDLEWLLIFVISGIN
jgi:hypothetical protein